MRKADNLPPSCAVVTKSGNLNFLEPSGPFQACNGTDLPALPFTHLLTSKIIVGQENHSANFSSQSTHYNRSLKCSHKGLIIEYYYLNLETSWTLSTTCIET